jgi:hypothetical protein
MGELCHSCVGLSSPAMMTKGEIRISESETNSKSQARKRFTACKQAVAPASCTPGEVGRPVAQARNGVRREG